MKIALVTTTINVPTVLKWYRAIGDAQFIVVGDKKTPRETEKFCKSLSNCEYITCAMQEEYKCSEKIGWDSIQRRNIGFLEALVFGADVVISIDDDNLPLNEDYFTDFGRLFALSFNGLRVSATDGFFDIGNFLVPRQKQRGIPHNNAVKVEIDSATGAKIGVAQGLCIGAADIDAATRFNNPPDVHQISEVARAGFVVSPMSRTIWNSQNTAIVRELLPAWGMIPHIGRHDDIFASVVCHRIMRDHGYYAHYGLPMVYQQRNPHNLVKDMRAEIDGYENVAKLAQVLDHTILANKSILDDCRQIWRTLTTCDFMPIQSIKAMEAYLDDVESVL